MSRVIVKNLPKGTTEQKLKAHIGEGFSITDCSLKYTRDGKFRHFAFLGFKTEEEAQLVLKKYNKSFLNTSRLEIQICQDLGEERKSRSWSKYAKDSSAYKREHKIAADQEAEKKSKSLTKKEKKQKQKEKKDKKVEELFGELTNDPEFQEFLDLHKANNNKTMWDNDSRIPEPEQSKTGPSTKTSTQSDDVSKSVAFDGDDSEDEDSDDEEIDNRAMAAPKKDVSDLEYLKSKVSSTDKNALVSDSDSSSSSSEDESSSDEGGSSDSESDVISEKRSNEIADEEQTEETDEQQEVMKYVIKMKGLPVGIKEAQIKEFFTPITPSDIKIPRNAKGSKAFCVATVEFLNENDQTKAMGRNKNFIGNKRIFLHKSQYLEKPEPKEKVRVWENRVYNTEKDGEEESIAESGRLYLRNLPYCCTQEDLEQAFEKFGPLVEVHLPIDKTTKKIKGFAFILYMIPEHAVAAYTEMDGKIFQGRLMHILPARASRDQGKNPEAKTFKEQQEQKLKAQAGSSHNWNTLFLGANAVAEVMAEKYGTSKDKILDESDGQSLGVRMALGETQIVSETRDFLIDNGVKLESFSQPTGARSKTVILAKNLPAGTLEAELRTLFEKHGTLARILLPPAGVTAIVEFLEPTEAKAAFRNLAYTKFKYLPLYLEWAPLNVFKPKSLDVPTETVEKEETMEEENDGAEEEKQQESEAGSTLFVKNLNFDSTEGQVEKVFEKCGKIKSVTISLKKDLKVPGQLLSMGFGFVEYYKKKSADMALRTLQGVIIDDHALELKVSHRATKQKEAEAASLKRKQGQQGKPSTKILVRNIPFEANAKEVQELFSVFGELKFCRLPKKMSGSGSHRGFAFVEFLTKNDAKRAFDALCHSTHLYGRRLVLEWASEDDSVDQLRDKTAHYFMDTTPSKKLKKSALNEALQGGSTQKQENF